MQLSVPSQKLAFAFEKHYQCRSSYKLHHRLSPLPSLPPSCLNMQMPVRARRRRGCGRTLELTKVFTVINKRCYYSVSQEGQFTPRPSQAFTADTLNHFQPIACGYYIYLYYPGPKPSRQYTPPLLPNWRKLLLLQVYTSWYFHYCYFYFNSHHGIGWVW